MTQTLEQLENDDWGEPSYDSHLVTTCHRLRRKPLDQFTTEDLRIMIGQNISLERLLPLAMDVLHKEPLAEGDFYEGDLLCAVLQCERVVEKASPLDDDLLSLCSRAAKGLQEAASQEASELLGGTAEDLGLSEDAFDLLFREKAQQILSIDRAHKTIQHFLQTRGHGAPHPR